MRRIARAGYLRMPWKNGGGMTTQIAIFPEAATTENFQWRISTAEVTADGAFSEFVGIDRTLVVLEGSGIDLAVAGNRVQRIDRGSDPFSFAADAPAYARLVAGSILDLNIMTRRECYRHRARKFRDATAWTAAGRIVVLFAASASLRIDDGFQTIRVASGDTVVFDDHPGKLEINPATPGDYYLVEISRV
jgi:environmental stress-induced protein Ves